MSQTVLFNLGLAVVYYIAGLLGQLFAIAPAYVTPLWPAAVVALGALLLYGYKLWPGILLGSALLHLQLILTLGGHDDMSIALMIAASMAVGITLQGIVGAYLINRSVDIKTVPLQTASIVKILLIGGPLSCLISASWSSMTLWSVDQLQANEPGFIWLNWWLRDSFGVVILLPVILALFARPRRIWKSYKLSVALPIMVALLVVTAIFNTASKKESQLQQGEFRAKADQLADSLEKMLVKNIEVLYSVQNLFNSSSAVPRGQFNQYAQRSLQRNSTIKAIGFNRIVFRHDRANFERSVQAQGFPGFSITERNAEGQLVSAQSYDKHVVVDYITPLAGNEKAFGYDVYTNESRRIALDRASSSGKLVATSAIKLVQETANQNGILFMLPVYNSKVLPLQEAREKMTKGFIVGVYRLGDLVTQALENMSVSNIHVHLVDMTPGTHNKQLADYLFNTQGQGQLLEKISHCESGGAMKYHRDVEFGQRIWRINIDATPEYLIQNRTFASWYVFITGLLFCAMMGGFLLIVSSSNLQDKIHVRELAMEVKQRQSIQTKLHNANDELKKLATTDSLTNVHNRRSIEHLGTVLEAESLRYQEHYSVIMLDVDHFKTVNDRWGHKMGDKVLLSIASKIRSQLRDTDFVGRWGGEEFIILSKHISMDASVEFANRVRKTISTLKNGSVGQVTISVGVSRNHAEEKFEDVLLRADKALYLAKERGRNRVEAIA